MRYDGAKDGEVASPTVGKGPTTPVPAEEK